MAPRFTPGDRLSVSVGDRCVRSQSKDRQRRVGERAYMGGVESGQRLFAILFHVFAEARFCVGFHIGRLPAQTRSRPGPRPLSYRPGPVPQRDSAAEAASFVYRVGLGASGRPAPGPRANTKAIFDGKARDLGRDERL